MEKIESRGYAHPEKLVSTEWLAEHLGDPEILVVESNEDPLLYPSGHIPGAFEVDWTRDLNDPIVRDYLDEVRFEALLQRIGYRGQTLVFYGDRNNWWATYALWVFALFGIENTKILDGGRIKWAKEGRTLTTDVPQAPAVPNLQVVRNDTRYRVFRDEVLQHVRATGKLIDVRSPDEFNGLRTHMDGYPNEGALRAGHIPGAKNVPWAKAVNPETAEFLSLDELRKLYLDEAQVQRDDDVVVYCRIGERSSHTWFVLHYLLGFQKVRNYDGSWTEWGNLVGVPIER